MLKRIQEMKNLARFSDYTGNGSHDFKRYNAIYAENGRGKSTITAVCRSANDGQASRVRSRKRLGQTTEPTIKLLEEDGDTHIFNGTSWSSDLKNLLVFDQEFVDGNVFVGGKVDYRQKLGLYEVFVGAQTGNLVQEIATADAGIRETNNALAGLRPQISGLIESNLTIDEFIKLEKPEEPKKKVEALEIELNKIENKTKLIQAPAQSEIRYTAIDFSGLKPAIETTFKTISAETTKAVQAKISELDSSSAEDWLEKGHEFCKKTKGKCPYCSQDLNPSKIAEVYGEYFNRDYKQSLQQLINYRNRMLQELSISSLIGFEAIVSKNNELYTKWSVLIKTMKNPTFNVAGLQKKLTVVESLIGSLLEKKIKNPLESQEIDSELQIAITELDGCFQKLVQYNKNIQFNNGLIQKLKAGLSSTRTREAVKNDIARVNDCEKRHTEKVNKICGEYLVKKNLKDGKGGYEEQKSAARTRLDKASEQILSAHLASINQCLADFGTSYRLREITKNHQGGRPNSTFVIEINGEPVSADSNDENSPSLQTALSAGDKTTLAFAFFVSCVANEVNIKNYTVMIDDPISSLDYGRKTFTIKNILEIFSKSKQGILLSHDPDFLHDFWVGTGNLPDSNSRASFELVRKASNTTGIEHWSASRHAETLQKSRINLLQTYHDEGLTKGVTLQNIAENIRPALEHVFKAIYPKELPSSDTLGNFVGVVRTTNIAYLSTIKGRLKDLEAVNDFATSFSSHDPAKTATSLKDTEVSTIVNKALSLIRT